MSGQDIVNYAKTFLGVPYVFGGTTPRGFDCSGFVKYVYGHFGHILSRTTKEQINNGREVGRSELQVGDLVFPTSGHVTIYLGNNSVIHAPRPGQVVKIENLWAFWRARRIIGDTKPVSIPESIPVSIPKNKQIPPGPFPIKTSLHPTGDNFDFLLGDYNNDGYLDLYCIKKWSTGTKSVEVHILSGKSNYQKYLLQTGTPHKEVDEKTSFVLGDYNRNGILDLYCIEKRGCGKIYLNILKGEANFKEWIMNVPTCCNEVGDNVDFAVGDFQSKGMPDLYCITKYKEGCIEAGIVIIKAQDNYQSLLMDTRSTIKVGYDDCIFGLNDYVGHGKIDLYCIRRRDNNIGFEVVDGTHEKLFRTPLMETSFKCDDPKNCSFLVHGQDVFAIKKNGNNCTEVHYIKDHVQ